MDEKSKFGQALVAIKIATTGTSQIEKEVVSLYWEMFGLKVANWQQVLSKALNTCKRWPSLAELNEIAGIRDTTAADESKQIVDRIIDAISSCGWSNPDRARDYIGEHGWQLVARYGGWANVCETTYDQLNTMRAQMRGSLEANIKYLPPNPDKPLLGDAS